jgi:hypothetical protein
MRYFIIALFVGIFFVSCTKTNTVTDGNLSGSWKMVRVYDKAAGTEYSKPSQLSGEVVIRFTNGGFSGHTLVNQLNDGTYTFLNNSQLTFGSFSMTQVNEDSWGAVFLTVLNACMLQSLYPCTPSVVTYQPGLRQMKISTPLKYDILLEKL